MKRTFISHSSKDKEIGETVCRFLESHGISCWIAPRDVMPGKNYGAAIIDAIDECGVFVLILSGESNKSGQVVREVEHAASTDSVIIPLRVESVQPSRDLEFYVSSSHWLDATERPLEKHLGALVDAINNWQKPAESPDESGPLKTSPPIATAAPKSRAGLIIGGIAIAVVVCAAAVFYATRSSPRNDLMAPVATSSGPETNRVGAPPASVAAPTSRPASSATVSPNESPASGEPEISRVVASSEEHVVGQVHNPELAFDGNMISTWLSQTDGVGQWITAYFKTPTTITSVAICNGNCSNKMRYENANRIQTLRVTFSDGTSQVITFEQKLTLQRFELPHPVVAEWAKFEILSIWSGTRFFHTPVSEIMFNREASDMAPAPGKQPEPFHGRGNAPKLNHP